MAHTDVPDALAKIEARAKDVPWYNPKIEDKLGDSAREVLENYSKIPAAEVEDHVYKLVMFNIYREFCRFLAHLLIERQSLGCLSLSMYRWLPISWHVCLQLLSSFHVIEICWEWDCLTFRAISLSPDYPVILDRLKSKNEKFLNLGCCFGQDIRRLAYDGARQSHLYGADLRPEFFDLGYELFLDESTLKAKFFAADIFDASSPLAELDGKVDIIYAGSFLHLFHYEQQVAVCKRIVRLLRDKKGSVVLGRQAGNVESGEKVHRTNKEQSMFRHNEQSFRKMWEEVGEATGTEWRADVKLFEVDRKSMKWVQGSDERAIRFSIWRE